MTSMTTPPVDHRQHTRLAGALYVVTFLSSIPALALLEPLINDADFILGGGAANGRVLGGAVLDMVNALACIGTAVVLFPVVRRYNETLALGFVTTRVLEACVIFMGVVAVASVVALQPDAAAVASSDPATLTAIGGALVALRNATFLLGPGLIPVFNALLLGSLLLRARLMPTAIPIIGLIGAPLLLVSTLLTLFGVHEQVSVTSAVAAIPIALWEFSLAIWLIVRGLRTTGFDRLGDDISARAE